MKRFKKWKEEKYNGDIFFTNNYKPNRLTSEHLFAMIVVEKGGCLCI